MIAEREAKLNAAREQEEKKKRAFRKAQKKKNTGGLLTNGCIYRSKC